MSYSIAYNLNSVVQMDLSRLHKLTFDKSNEVFIKVGNFVTKVFGATSSRLSYQNGNFISNSITNSNQDVFIDKREKEIFFARMKLDKSFEKTLKKVNSREFYKETYQEMARTIQLLNFEDCFVDISQTRKLVEFNLSFKNDLFVSIAKNLNDVESDEVMFAISHEQQNIVIDQMNLKTLIEKIVKSQEIVNSSSK